MGGAEEQPVMVNATAIGETRPTSAGCPACGAADTITVTLTVAGSPASFTSCPTCEWKGWQRDGQTLTLGSVLTLVAAR
jgi:hypothetical protein